MQSDLSTIATDGAKSWDCNKILWCIEISCYIVEWTQQEDDERHLKLANGWTL